MRKSSAGSTTLCFMKANGPGLEKRSPADCGIDEQEGGTLASRERGLLESQRLRQKAVASGL